MNPDWFCPLVEEKPFLTFGMPRDVFIPMAGVAEFTMGFGLIWTPLVRRSVGHRALHHLQRLIKRHLGPYMQAASGTFARHHSAFRARYVVPVQQQNKQGNGFDLTSA